MIRFFQVDAFTDTLFTGNPAAVCILNKWPETDVLQKIAQENFLPETAFFIPLKEESHFHLRWFTPDIEMDLCGHATLACAHVLYTHLDYKHDVIFFHSNSGILTVTRKNDFITLAFPSRMPQDATLPAIIEQGIGMKPREVLKARDYILVFDHEDEIKNCKPDRSLLDQINLDPGGIIITAKGKEVDFVSRYFTTQSTIFEDPVTGSAHCSLIPYWSNILGKQEMVATQLSARGGKLFCKNAHDRVLISGQAKTFCEGSIHL